jgi:type IV secretion system protein VirB4
MLALKHFRDTHAGLADLLNYAALIDDGVVQGKDGSLLVGWFYRGQDSASSTDAEREWISGHVNRALSRLGSGWATWQEAIKMPASGYPPVGTSAFPDPVSRLVDDERRRQFNRAGAHYDTAYALLALYTPPLRQKGRLIDMMYDDEPDEVTEPASRILDGLAKACAEIEDTLGDAVRIRRMGSIIITDGYGRDHLQDELVNYLQFAITGLHMGLNLPPGGAYLDAVLGGLEFWPGDTPRIGDKFIACVSIEGFPPESYPGMLDVLDHLPVPYRWSNRTIYLDQHEALTELHRYRRKWKQKIRGFWSQVFKTQGGVVNEDAALMTSETEDAMARTSSGLVGTGYLTSVVVLMDEDRAALMENARLIAREIRREGFLARTETVNAVEAWLGTLAGLSLPNVRRPLIHTDNLADLLPLSGVWTGRDANPCPFYPVGSPPLLLAATTGATPFRVNLHVGDIAHTLIFGPTGAGKSTLLCTIALQALRYPGVTICAFDKGRSMKAVALACQGRHYDIGAGDTGPSLCPLSVLETEANLAWAEDWIATCFELQTEKPPTPNQRDAIHRAMLLLRGDDLRSLTHFVALVQDENVRSALRYYTLDGALGGLLDAHTDGVSDARLTVFEIDELMAMKEQAAIPALLYLFRRFERSLKGQPAYLLLDEAWVMLGNPVFRAKVREWLKVLRKANCAVILATQSLSDAACSGILDALIESCPTKIFLPNEEASIQGTPEHPGPRDFYEAMGLNETQIRIIQTATKKRHYYFTSPEGRRLVDLSLGPIALAFAGVSSKDELAEIDALVQRHGEGWPLEWLNAKGIDYDQAP